MLYLENSTNRYWLYFLSHSHFLIVNNVVLTMLVLWQWQFYLYIGFCYAFYECNFQCVIVTIAIVTLFYILSWEIINWWLDSTCNVVLLHEPTVSHILCLLFVLLILYFYIFSNVSGYFWLHITNNTYNN